MIEPIPFAGYIDIGEDMTLIEEATKLANDIAEYAPSTNIELMIRDLIKEIERLQSEKINATKSKAKVKAS
jgi:hypothetical protein